MTEDKVLIRKRLYVPIWIVKALFLAFIFVGSVAGLIASSKSNNKGDDPGALVYIIFALGVSAIIMVVELILFCRRRLKPILYLWSSVIVAISMGTISITAIVEVSEGSFQSAGLAVDVIICVIATCAYFTSVIHAGILYHRQRKSRGSSHTVEDGKSQSAPLIGQINSTGEIHLQEANSRQVEAGFQQDKVHAVELPHAPEQQVFELYTPDSK